MPRITTTQRPASGTYTFNNDSVFARGLVGFWPMQPYAGSNRPVDISPASFHAISGSVVTRSTMQYGGGALNFTATNSSALVGIRGVNMAAGTWMAWIKPTSNTNSIVCEIASVRFGTTNNLLFSYSVVSSIQRLRLVWAGGGSGQLADWTGFTFNIWTHAACTWLNGSPPKVYANGVLVATSGVNYATQTLTTFTIGNDSAATNGFRGHIADLGMWNYAMNDAQIKQYYSEKWPLYKPKTIQEYDYVAPPAPSPTSALFFGAGF